MANPSHPASRGILRGSLASVGVRLLDLPSRYGFHLLIAATLGVTQAGRFYIVYSALVAISGLGRLGIDRALSRQIAIAVATGESSGIGRQVGRMILRGGSLVLLISTALTLLLAAGAAPFADIVLGKPYLAMPLALGALTIVPQNLSTVVAGALAGLHRVGRSQMIYSWLPPALFCAAAVATGITVPGALILNAASFAVAALVGGVLLWQAWLRLAPATETSPGPASAPVAEPALLRPALSLFTLELTQLLMASMPALILGIVANDTEVGLFALAWRIALLINLPISGIVGMAAPTFARCHALGDRDGLARASAQAVGLGLVLAAPAALAMLVAPSWMLTLIGHGYRAGVPALRILALGQLAAACFTAMPDLLGMTDQMSALRRVNAASLLTLLAGGVALAPLAGSTGAALATAAAIAVNGGGAAWAARRALGIGPLALLFPSDHPGTAGKMEPSEQ